MVSDSESDTETKLVLEQFQSQISKDKPKFKAFESAFRKVAIHDPKKSALLEKKNKNLAADEREDAPLTELYITLESMENGFSSVFGAKCDVIARVIYYRASNGREHCKLNFRDFWNVF